MSNIEKHRAFINSLEGEKGLPEEMHGWPFSASVDSFESYIRESEIGVSRQKCLYLLERCRRAESRQIPDLKERVKELVRDAMEAVETYRDARWGGEHLDERERKAYKAFRALCEPEVKL